MNDNSTVIGSLGGSLAAVLDRGEERRVRGCSRKECRTGLADLRSEADRCWRIESVSWLLLAAASAAALAVSLGLY